LAGLHGAIGNEMSPSAILVLRALNAVQAAGAEDDTTNKEPNVRRTVAVLRILDVMIAQAQWAGYRRRNILFGISVWALRSDVCISASAKLLVLMATGLGATDV
jgi:hypothetical protein